MVGFTGSVTRGRMMDVGEIVESTSDEIVMGNYVDSSMQVV